MKLNQALFILNSYVNVINSDYDGEVAIYVLGEENQVKEACKLIGLDFKEIYDGYNAEMDLEENEIDMLPIMDAINQKFSTEIWHDEKKGFFIAMDRVKEVTHRIFSDLGTFEVALDKGDFETTHKILSSCEDRIKKLRNILDMWG